MKRLPSHILIGLFITVLQLMISSCVKEYSYEGGNVPFPVITLPVDTTAAADTVIPDPGALPNCIRCIDSMGIRESSWSFNTGSSLLCGHVDTAFTLNLERSTFTFFGPSFCGADTGLVFTVSLGATGLNADINNLQATSAIFYYYHTNQPYILLSHADQSFTFTIVTYNHTTKMVVGTFSGTGFRGDGRAVYVSNGKFRFFMP